MKALVTGGGGFLGLYIVEQLVARGDRVRVLCRGNYPALARLGVECVSGDLRDPAAVIKAAAGIDTVFHAAAVAGIWGPWKHYYSINTQGTQNVIDACRAQSVARLVFTSSPSVVYDGRDHCQADETLPYPSRYLCHYPHTKALAEKAVLAANGRHGLLTTALRPHLIWGARDGHLIPRLIARAKAGRLRLVGDGSNLISMSYVENAAAAHLQAADRLVPGSPVGGQAYFINEPSPVRLGDWIGEILKRAGLTGPLKSISPGVAYLLGGALEAVYTLLRLRGEPPMTRFLAQQLSGSHSYKIEKAQRDFGYHPVATIEQGLAHLEADLRSAESMRTETNIRRL
jgi:2-alkyl-3-oxoalkanoate reductase